MYRIEIKNNKLYKKRYNNYLKYAKLRAPLRASIAARVSYYSYVKVLTYICTWKKRGNQIQYNATNNEIT